MTGRAQAFVFLGCLMIARLFFLLGGAEVIPAPPFF